MSAQEFLANAKNGTVSVDSHEKVLWLALIYLDHGLWDGNGVFDVVEKLHKHGWSFGTGELRFNRTLDIFYLVQTGTALNRSEEIDGDWPSPDNFDTFYKSHYALLNPSAWRSYYSEPFLKHPTTARFYRLPNLQDLPDTDSPLDQRRKQPYPGTKNALKLPRWAYNVARTRHKQRMLPLDTFTEVALRTLKSTIERLRAVDPGIPPYSETQAHFWLEHMRLGSADSKPVNKYAWTPDKFGILAAQGYYDVYQWQEKYSVQAWEASWETSGVVEPDVEDGAWKSEIMWCGLPDGGIEFYAWLRGWEGELGGEEEVEFLAAVAVEETVGIELGRLDLAVRSHMLLGVMHAAIKEGQEREDLLKEVERGMVQSGRIGEDRAGVWLREALKVVEPYIRIWNGVWPDEKEWAEVLRQILVDNGQLFGRWKRSPHLNEFNFELGPRKSE